MFEITTYINNKLVVVTCNEASARVLLPAWAHSQPILTTCFDLETNKIIESFP